MRWGYVGFVVFMSIGKGDAWPLAKERVCWWSNEDYALVARNMLLTQDCRRERERQPNATMSQVDASLTVSKACHPARLVSFCAMNKPPADAYSPKTVPRLQRTGELRHSLSAFQIRPHDHAAVEKVSARHTPLLAGYLIETAFLILTLEPGITAPRFTGNGAWAMCLLFVGAVHVAGRIRASWVFLLFWRPGDLY